MSQDADLLEVDVVARKLSLSPEHVREMLRDGELRGLKVGKKEARWRVPASEVAAYIARRLRDRTDMAATG